MGTQKVRLSSLKTAEIELDDGSKVIVKGSLDFESFNVFARAAGNEEDQEAQIKVALEFLEKVIIGWNFVDMEGKQIEYKPELVRDLDIETTNTLIMEALKIYTPEKKSSESSEPT